MLNFDVDFIMADHNLDSIIHEVGPQQPDDSKGKPIKLQACVRCHAQKLRCLRSSVRDCTRCLASGSKCIARTPRRMGRPKESRRQDPTSPAGSGEHRTSSDEPATPTGPASDQASKKRRRNTQKSARTKRRSQGVSSAVELLSQATAENLWNALKEAGWYRHDDINNGNTKTMITHEGGGESTRIDIVDDGGDLQQNQFDTSMGDSWLPPKAGESDDLSNSLQHNANINRLMGGQYFDTSPLLPDSSFGPLFHNTNIIQSPGIQTKPQPLGALGKSNEPPATAKNTLPVKDFLMGITMDDLAPDHMTTRECSQQLSKLCFNLFQGCGDLSTPTSTPSNEPSSLLFSPLFGNPSPNMSSRTTTPSLDSYQKELGVDAILKGSQDFIDILQKPLKQSDPAVISTEYFGPQSPGFTSMLPPDLGSLDLGPAEITAFPTERTKPDPGGCDRSTSDPRHFDSMTILLSLACYLQLLQRYDQLVCSLLEQEQQKHWKPMHTQQTHNPELPHLLDLRVGNFSLSSTSELQVVLLVQIISHLVDRIDKMFQSNLASIARGQNVGSDGGSYKFGISKENGESGKTGSALEIVAEDLRTRVDALRKKLEKLRSAFQDSMAF